MVFRVTQFQNDQQFLLEFQRARDNESRVLERLSTLKKVNRASDDPLNYGRIAETRDQIEQNEAFRQNIQATQDRLAQTEIALTSIRDALDRARELTLEGVSITNTAAERQTVAQEISQLRANIFNRLNTQHEGEYIFSGTNTNIEPFQDLATGNYSGNTDLVEVRISESENLTTNFIGSEVAYGPGGQGGNDDILDVLSDLATSFAANNVALANLVVPRLAETSDRINTIISEVGTRGVRLIAQDDTYSKTEVALRSVLADLEDADLAEEALNLEQQRTLIDSQLRSQGSINRQSLLDFIG